ncbi:MAG TPA: hypothetical protein PK336_00315 [Methanoculleus sp.]|nr:hypothetical protein [Candidatus Omnitrophota bacterium]HQN90700.1 hypothetical protein [Methanoculleus sp.]
METKTEQNLMPKKNQVYDLIDYIVNTIPGLIMAGCFAYALMMIKARQLPDETYLICVLICGAATMLGVILFFQNHDMWFITKRLKELEQKK